MPRDYKTLRAAIQGGESVRLRDGTVVSRVEDLPLPQSGDLRGRAIPEDEARKLLKAMDEQGSEIRRLAEENEKLRAGQPGDRPPAPEVPTQSMPEPPTQPEVAQPPPSPPVGALPPAGQSPRQNRR